MVSVGYLTGWESKEIGNNKTMSSKRAAIIRSEGGSQISSSSTKSSWERGREEKRGG